MHGPGSRAWRLLLVSSFALCLCGCVPLIAANAVSAVAQSARTQDPAAAASAPDAVAACTSRAAQYGTVHIIDAEQRPSGKIVVWGTVDDGKRKRSFQCDHAARITGFRLRDIAAPQRP